MQVANWETQCLNIQEILELKPHFIEYILRLTVEESLEDPTRGQGLFARMNVHSSTLTGASIISSFTNVKIIAYPLADVMEYLPPRVEVIWIGCIRANRMGHELRLGSIQATLRSLTLETIYFDMIPFIDEAPHNVSFLALTTLKVDTDEEIIEHITEHWDLPVLSTFSILTRGSEEWIPFLRKCRQSIRKLDMGPWNEFDGGYSTSSPFDMPVLSSLAFEVDDDASLPWITNIQSKSLQHVSIYNIDFVENFASNPEKIKEMAQKIILSYPSIKSLCLYERGRALSPHTRYGLDQEDISALEKGGITVDVLKDARTEVKEEITQDFVLSESPVSQLQRVLGQHRDLRQVREQPGISTFTIEDSRSGALIKQATYSIGKYLATGEPAATQIDAKNNAASRLLEMIREDIY